MKTRLRKEHVLPRRFNVDASSGLIHECDLPLIQGCRLRVKLLVFERPACMRRFWVKYIYPFDGLSPGTLGAVSRLSCSVISAGREQREYEEYDPRYLCVIALCRKHITVEIVMHEAVHAGFAWAKRKVRAPWDACSLDLDEESVCYPAGRIASDMCYALEKAGFIER